MVSHGGSFTESKNHGGSSDYDLRSWMTGITMSTYIEELFYADGPGTAYYNGNITSLTRYGKGASGYGLMDNLTIAYTGNQPTSVSESASDYNVSGSFEYKKANGSGYKFNENGSLVADKSRGIAYITYDLNNNPKQIYFTNGSVTKYVYSASGQKLRAVHYTAKPNITRTWGEKPAELTMAQILLADSTDYLMGGSLTMKNGKIDKFLFEGGYAQASVASSTTDNFAFYFYNQDHLGNIREVVDASGAVKQVTNYYPFGAPYADASAATNADFQPYKYNGKELDKMHGLNTYDYGARQHDPILARWDRIDPLCEKYYSVSPYVYCDNNPINAVDPDGRKVKPLDDNAFEIIKMTLPQDSRKYVVLNESGYIDSNVMKQYTGYSNNFKTLLNLVTDDMDIDVSITSTYDSADENGKVSPHSMGYGGVDESLIDSDFQFVSGLTTGEDGFAGKTLFPDRDGKENSVDNTLHIIVNEKFTKMGKIETFAHEAYGHTQLYLLNGHNHKGASHQSIKMKETNLLLKQMIINARKEAVKNAN